MWFICAQSGHLCFLVALIFLNAIYCRWCKRNCIVSPLRPITWEVFRPSAPPTKVTTKQITYSHQPRYTSGGKSLQGPTSEIRITNSFNTRILRCNAWNPFIAHGHSRLYLPCGHTHTHIKQCICGWPYVLSLIEGQHTTIYVYVLDLPDISRTLHSRSSTRHTRILPGPYRGN